jgi:Xaa-Pro aminopeptidase
MAKGWTGPKAAQRKAQARIAAEMAEVGFALPGSLAARSYRCGKPNCACATDPERVHGPYNQWSWWVDGRTRNTNLSEEQLADYQEYFDNATRLRQLVEELEALTIEVISSDPRLKPGTSRPSAARPRKKSRS